MVPSTAHSQRFFVGRGCAQHPTVGRLVCSFLARAGVYIADQRVFREHHDSLPCVGVMKHVVVLGQRVSFTQETLYTLHVYVSVCGYCAACHPHPRTRVLAAAFVNGTPIRAYREI